MPKVQGKYKTGQLFLHRIFGYRGVVLFPWLARVYDRDLPNNSTTTNATVTDSGSAPATATTTTTTISSPIGAGSSTTEIPAATTDDTDNIGNRVNTTNNNNSGSTDVKGKTNTFYQVLIDSRDCPYIVS